MGTALKKSTVFLQGMKCEVALMKADSEVKKRNLLKTKNRIILLKPFMRNLNSFSLRENDENV